MSQGFALGKQGRSEKSVDTDRPVLTVVNKYPLYFVYYFGVFLHLFCTSVADVWQYESVGAIDLIITYG